VDHKIEQQDGKQNMYKLCYCTNASKLSIIFKRDNQNYKFVARAAFCACVRMKKSYAQKPQFLKKKEVSILLQWQQILKIFCSLLTLPAMLQFSCGNSMAFLNVNASWVFSKMVFGKVSF